MRPSILPKRSRLSRRNGMIAGQRSNSKAARRPRGGISRHLQIGIAIAGIIFTLAALVVAWLAFRQDQSSMERSSSAQLKVVGEPAVRTTNEIRAQFKDDSEPTWSQEAEMELSVIDVVLENTGGRPALISSVEATISEAAELEDCREAVGGAVYITALYSITVPYDNESMMHPISLQAEFPFAVEANSVDRLAITVGPDKSFGSGFVYHTDIRLRLADGSLIELGRFILLAPIETASVIAAVSEGIPQYPDCMRNNVAAVEQALAGPGRKAPALVEFSSAMRSLGFVS